MAVMRKEPKDIAELGSIGIVKEALKLYAAHSKVYIVIQLELMLPLAILLLVAEYFVITQHLLLPVPTPRILRAVHTFDDLDVNLQHFEVRIPGWLARMLVSIAASLVYQAAVSLSLSTTLYTVGQFYAGQRVSFFNAVRAATPRLWMRLALTTVYVNVLTYSITLLQTVASRLLQEYDYYEQWRWVWAGVVTVLFLVAGFGLGILLTISSGVSVLEEDYGWAAMKRGLKLLDGKVNVAILLQVLWIVPGIIEIGLNAAILFQLTRGDFYVASDVTFLLFTGVVFLAWTTFSWELQSLCAGVQYVSFKAYHDESLSDSLYEKRTVVVEWYERFRDESKVALLKGALVKGNVV